MEEPENGRGCDRDEVDGAQEDRDEEDEAVEGAAAPGGPGLTVVSALVRVLCLGLRTLHCFCLYSSLRRGAN